jgi:hypothetical protein
MARFKDLTTEALRKEKARDMVLKALREDPRYEVEGNVGAIHFASEDEERAYEEEMLGRINELADRKPLTENDRETLVGHRSYLNPEQEARATEALREKLDSLAGIKISRRAREEFLNSYDGIPMTAEERLAYLQKKNRKF